MTSWNTALAVGGVVWYSVLVAVGALGCVTARRKYRHRSHAPREPSVNAPGVSILRPLKGLDTNLYENLESTFTQDYPNYEIILSVADAHDQALLVVRELMVKYPRTKARVIIGEEVVGVNPKVNNLIRPYREAAHDILWILDSNIAVEPLTLARSVHALTIPPIDAKRQITLVHHVPFAVYDEWALGSAVEAVFLNTNHAKMYVAINAIAIDSCVVGKSCLYRRSDLERVGGPAPVGGISSTPAAARGLPAFGRFLAEDNMIANALWHELDARHALGPDVARNAVGRMRLIDYVRRRVRWIRVRKNMVTAATLVEPLTEGVMLGALLATSLHHLYAVRPGWTLLGHAMWWIVVDLDVHASLAGHPMPAGQCLGFVGVWLLREFLALPIWMLAMLGNTVEWRGRQYTIMRNGEVGRATKENGATEYEALPDA